MNNRPKAVDSQSDDAFIPCPWKWLAPDDPLGPSNKYRACRIVLHSAGEFCPLCKILRTADGSVVFSLSNAGFVPNETGRSILAAGKFQSVSAESLLSIRPEDRRSTHVTLHTDGKCHLRAQGQKPLFEHNIGTWYPVHKEFHWLEAYSHPVNQLSSIPKPKSRDAIVQFPDRSSCAEVAVDILPVNGKGNYACNPKALSTLFGVGGQYVIRVSVHPHAAVAPAIFVSEDLSPLDRLSAGGTSEARR